jgi:hypothetical protein
VSLQYLAARRLMKLIIPKIKCVCLVTGFALFGAALPAHDKTFAAFEERTAITPQLSRGRAGHATKLNQIAFESCKELIRRGRVIIDKKGAWGQHQPSPEEENEFIRVHGFEEYAKWHLGIDEGRPEATKARYKFPCGDFKNVHRCALLAVKSRAAQFNYDEIEKAASDLLQLIGMQRSYGATPLPQ